MKATFDWLARRLGRQGAGQAMALVLLAVPPAVLSGLWHPRAPVLGEAPLESGEVLLETALEWEKVLWVDARSREQYESGHVPGAVLLNEDNWEELFGEFLFGWEPEQKIVVYCGGGQCHASHQVADRLREDLESDEVYVLKGGWPAWAERR